MDKWIYIYINNKKIGNIISDKDYLIELQTIRHPFSFQTTPTLWINQMICFESNNIHDFNLVLNLTNNETDIDDINSIFKIIKCDVEEKNVLNIKN